MTVNTMRVIDRYVGIPLCFIATFICKLMHLFSGRKPPKKILFIELSEMGSAILADPAMRLAKKRYGAELFFVIFKNNKPSLDLLSTVPEANIFTIRPDGLHLIIDTIRFLVWTRKNKIDTVIDIELFSRYTALLTGLSGASNRVGFYRFFNEGLYRGNMLTHNVAYNATHHIAKNFVSLVNSLSEDKATYPMSKVKVEDSDIILHKAEISPVQKEAILKKIDQLAAENWRQNTPRILLINPNASDLLPQRRWPADNFIELIKIILGRFDDTLVLITGAKKEYELAEKIKAGVNNTRCISFTGQASLKEMIHLYSVSTAMITNDSGPGHFSAVTDMPSVVIFGPETPALYGSLGNSTPLYIGLACSPCVSASNHRKTMCTDNQCIKLITPEYAAEALSKLIINGKKCYEF